MVSRNLALFSERLTDEELLGCIGAISGERSPLSPLQAPATGAALDGRVWAGLQAKGVASPTSNRLKVVWHDAFETLARATTRLALLLGTPEGVEESAFYARGPLEEEGIVACAPTEGGRKVSFPVSTEDVVALVEDHLSAEEVDEQTGFWQELTLAEYAALLAQADLGNVELDSGELAALWKQHQSSADGRLAETWGQLISPWPLELDDAAAEKALASLRRRGLLYSPSGSGYFVSPELADVLSSLAGMERFVAADFRANQAANLVFLLGAGALWLLDFGGQVPSGRDGEPRITFRSISPFHVRSALERLIDLSWAEINPGQKEGDVDKGVATEQAAVLSYDLSEEEVAALVEASGLAPASTSPLAALRPRPGRMPGEARRELQRRDLLEAGEPARPTAKIARTVKALAQPSLQIVEIGGMLPDLAVSRRCVSLDGQSRFVVGYNSDGQDHHILAFPLGPDQVFPIAGSLAGLGLARSIAPFSAVFEVEEYLVLLALVDLYRLTAIEAMLKRETSFRVAATAGRVEEMLRDGAAGADRRWLVTAARDLSPVSFNLQPEQISAALAGLAEKGHLVANSQSGFEPTYELTPDCSALCHSLSQAAAALGVILTIGPEPGMRPPLTVTAFWSTGLLWMADYGSGQSGKMQVSLQTMLQAELDLALRAAYHQACDEAGNRAAPAPQSGQIRWSTPVNDEAALAKEGPVCANCGAAVSAQARFCNTCGASVQPAQGPASTPPQEVPPAMRTCPRCQHQNSPTIKFCVQCGQPLG